MREWVLKIYVYSLSYYFVLFHKALLLKLSSNICEKSFRYLRHFLPFFFFVYFHWKITCQLGKVNKKVKTESQQLNWRSIFVLWVSTSLFVYSLKRPISYCCRISTILCMIFEKRLFIKVRCRPWFTKYAHDKPLFPFQNNE